AGSQNSGGDLTIFEYPTPAVGQYTIDVTGPEGPYTIKSYTYDQEGNLTDNGPTTTTTSSFNLYLNYDSDSSTPPIETTAVISEESSTTPSTSTALISWTTDKLTSSRVVYDTISHSQLGSPANYNYLYSSETFDIISKVLSHRVLLTGLSSGQIYYYRVVSFGSPTAVSPEKTFKTLSEAGAPPPAESNIALGNITTGFPFYKTFFVANEFPVEEKPTVQQVSKQTVLGEEAPPTKSFFMKNLGWFIILFLSSAGLFGLQLRRLLRLKAKKRTLKAKGGNRNRRTRHVRLQGKKQHS
ncbi:MAG: fibronectin type III domain-containing protein, partial [Candidatus Woesebacteria bacterium]|nr:fibronectin type III domain-containing protein [Candidatus Woesebacteria bacterium]